MSAQATTVDDWTSWTLFWFQAATSQRRRVFEANFFDRQSDALLYMDAMRNVVRGLSECSGSGTQW